MSRSTLTALWVAAGVGLGACSPDPAASPERRLLTGLAGEDWPMAAGANRLVHPRFVPASRPVDWMAWASHDLAGNTGTPERLFLREQPYAGPTLEARGPSSGGAFWVGALAAGSRAPLRVSLWVGLPSGERLVADAGESGGTRVELHGFDPATGADVVDTLAAGEVQEGPLPSPDGFDWFLLAATLPGDRLGQLELRVRTEERVVRLGQPRILGGRSRLALARPLPPPASSRRATPLDRRRAAERQREARRRPPLDERPEARDGALQRRRALRAMMRDHPPTSAR